MFPAWQLATISIVYIGLLFVIAYLGDKYRHKIAQKAQSIIYALSLGVYCTSWSFLGTTGQASSHFLSHIPIYLGPILLFVFAWSFIQRIIRVSLKLNLTSLADLLAARYGKSHNLAIMVTIVALVGTMPYIALQLKAIVYSFDQLLADSTLVPWRFGLIVSLALAGFTIMFGIRNIDVTERHPGVVLAIAFESLVKVLSFLAVGLFVCYFMFDSPMDIWRASGANLKLEGELTFPNLMSMAALLVVVMAAFLSLPRQFQVMVVELKDPKDTWLSRRVFPIYVLVFAIFAVPLGLAGQLLLGDTVPSDTYVLFLPWHGNQMWLTLLAFIGAFSAASSMVIISSIALSTMLSNEIVFPWVFRKNKQETDYDQFRFRLLNIRKVLVLVVILLGYSVFLMASPDTLSSLGEIAFGAFAQLTPALIAAFMWRRASLTGVYAGILVGSMMWLVFNFIPQFGFYEQPFSDGILPATSIVSLLSLSANIIVLWSVSHISRQSVQERVQASLFMEWQTPELLTSPKKKVIDYQELELLVSRFVGEKKAYQSFKIFRRSTKRKKVGNVAYNQLLLEHTESTLASVMGTSSARLVLSSALEGRDIALDEIALLVEDASNQRQKYSEHLLQSAIENASEGISIVDSELHLVAWNQKYLDLFNYPPALIYKGSPIEDLIRYNAQRGLCGAGEVEKQVAKRIYHLRNGSAHHSERQQPDGQVISIDGNPLPDGGFVMLFSDITAYRQAEQVLKEANQDLETRVLERTQSLARTNAALALAHQKAEQAHLKKSQFLHACSHDLMQPLEAARLFTTALAEQNNLTTGQRVQVDNIDHSLKVASDLIADLGEVARIESGNIKPQIVDFALNDLFESLAQEFSALSHENNVEFSFVPTRLWITSDKHLLRRMLQNLIGNAFRYASPGKVILGARRINPQEVSIQVLDNGPGIPADKQSHIFEQFTQLDNSAGSAGRGLGLGLNITQSLSQILAHTLQVVSQELKGSMFAVQVNRATPTMKLNVNTPLNQVGLKDVTVLCIDNDPDVLSGMVALLTGWHCNVLFADSFKQAQEVFAEHANEIEILLVDYQLEQNFNGLNLIGLLRKQVQHSLPAILITATTDSDIADKAANADVEFMRKMVKPAALRALMSAKLSQKLQQNYQ